MAEDGYDFISPSQQSTIWSIMNLTPFYPKVSTEDGEEFKLEFNQAYYFDYANLESLKEPKKITNTSHTLNRTGNKKFYVKVKITNENGRIESAEIIESKNPENEGKPNLSLKTSFTPMGDTQDIVFHILLAEFEGFSLKKIYLRDNLHFNYRKFEQLGGYDTEKKFPIIPEGDGPEKENGVIKFHAIAAKDAADNELSIELNDGILEFYVKGVSGSASGSV